MWPWRDLSWPILGIFFWWLAGRSIEALPSRRKILLPKTRWWEVVVSLPVSAFGAIWAAGLCIDQSTRPEFHLWMLLVGLGSMWFVLGSSTSVSYFMQWRLRRRLASSTVEQARNADIYQLKGGVIHLSERILIVNLQLTPAGWFWYELSGLLDHDALGITP